MKELTIALLGVCLFCSCGNKKILDESHTFDRNIWNRFTMEEFSFNVPNIDNYYNIDITVAVDTIRYRYDMVPIAVNLISPDGEKRRILTSVALKEKGRWRGEMQDGYRTAQGRVRSYFSFNHKGQHRMEVGQQTSQYDLEGIYSVAVHIEKAKLDYSNLD